MDREHPPKKPFKPRPGAVPRFLAGRDEELQAVEANIPRPLQDGEETSSNAALVSPKGFGKTALAETLRISAERQDLRTLDAPASALETMGELMAATIGREAMAQVQTAKRQAKERSVGLRTLLSRGWGKNSGAGAHRLAKCAKHPRMGGCVGASMPRIAPADDGGRGAYA